MNQQLIYELLRILEKSDKYLSGEELCKYLNISSRTLRSRIKENKKDFSKNGFSIVSKTRLGYVLIINDYQKYKKYKENLIKYDSLSSKEERQHYLLKQLLITDDYIKIADLQDMLHVSKYTLTQDFKDIKAQIKRYHLDIEVKPYYGMRIIGNEINIRSCLSRCINKNSVLLLDNNYKEYIDAIYHIVVEVLEEFNYILTDIGLKNLVLHIFLGIKRNQYSYIDTGLDLSKNKQEYEIAHKIYNRVNITFNINLPKIEIEYIMIHLLCKQLLDSNSKVEILPQTQELLEMILEMIKKEFNYDFLQDIDLFTLLLLHLQPMFQRIKYHLTIDNPLLEEIKDNNQLAFEMALACGKVIEENMNEKVSVEECGYLALHFALAIERYKESINKKNILVVCASGKGTSQMVLLNIKKRFEERISHIEAVGVYTLNTINLDSYDLIITTIPLDIKTDKVVVQIPYFIKEDDYNRIDSALSSLNLDIDKILSECFHENAFFINIHANTRDEVLIQMIDLLQENYNLPDNLYKSIIEREEVYSTEYGNAFALPHPVTPSNDRNLIVVGILDKPVLWQHKKVKYIFMLLFNKNEDEFIEIYNEILITLIKDDRFLNEISNENICYDRFKNIMKNILSQTNINDNRNIFDY